MAILNIRSLGAIIGAIALVTLAAACIMTPEEAHIRYGGQYYPGEFLLYGLGEEFWNEYDLNVSHIIFSSAGESNQALISGDIDINCGADSRTVALFNAIPDQALVIGTVQRGNRYSTVIRKDSEYQNWNDLKGEKIGLKLGTGAEGVLRKYFDQEGLDWNDYEWINLNVEDMIANLQQGTIEAFHAWEFTPSIAEAKGVGVVMRTYGDVALVPASIHTTKEFAENNRDAVVRFLAAHLEKADMIENDPQDAAGIASAAADEMGLDVSEDAFIRVFGRINFQIEFNETVIDAIRSTAQFLESEGKIEEAPEIVADSSYLEEAKELYESRK